MNHFLTHKTRQPANPLSEFVERFWMVENSSDKDHEIVIVPDARIDLIFSKSKTEPFSSHIIGIETEPSLHTVTKGTIIMGVGLRLLSVEYCLNYSIAPLLGKAMPLPPLTMGVINSDLNDFNSFCNKMEVSFSELIPSAIENRKHALFKMLYDTQGSLKVQEYADKCFWTTRQINRYFGEWFGLSLKEYCSILRFRASIDQIKEGNFFPGQNFSDQPHFIREVKKFTGVTPKELFKRQKDRFIQLSEE